MDVTVETGEKKHKESCRLIKNNDKVTKIDQKEAIEEDYGPCKRCFKEDVITKENHD